tara:strand:+ start:1619 stop:1852 length:234 start_codon:yes stop_codon:yes gene_type:complete
VQLEPLVRKVYRVMKVSKVPLGQPDQRVRKAYKVCLVLLVQLVLKVPPGQMAKTEPPEPLVRRVSKALKVPPEQTPR